MNVCTHISHTGGSMVSENEDIGIECAVCMDNKEESYPYSMRSRLCQILFVSASISENGA